MSDLIEVSYTGDLLAHRRCPRAWVYEKYAQFYPYEQVQAMEGRLIHHAMEWLTRYYQSNKVHALYEQLLEQLGKHFRVLWSRGIHTAFVSKAETLSRVSENLFPKKIMHTTVKVAIEGAIHSEYELRTVRKLLPFDFGGKSRLMLTGILDLVKQSDQPLSYSSTWVWSDEDSFKGSVKNLITNAKPNDIEIWDYKGMVANSNYLQDFIIQQLTYASLFKEKTGILPSRCVLFFINERDPNKQLIAIPISSSLVEKAEKWTIERVREIQQTKMEFEMNPILIVGGEVGTLEGSRINKELKKQCTACGQRFDCPSYIAYLGHNHPDTSITNVDKN